RLAANTNPDAIAPVLNTQARQHEPAKYSNLQLRLQPISERVIGKSGQILWPLFGAVGLVLLVACINAGSLLVVRGLARRREIAVRAALGAARWQLIRPVLADATAIAIAAAITGAALASAIVSGLKSLLATSLSLPLPRLDQTIVDVEALAIALAAAVISIFVASLVPALSAMRVDPAAAFNDNSRAASASRATIRFGIAATILQTTFSVVLLTGAGLLLRSLVHVIEQDPGYDREGVLTARVPMPFDARQRYGNQAQYEHYRNVLQTARAIPGVQSAAVTTVLPLGRVAASVDFIPEGQTARKDEYVQAYGITPDYFRVMGIALKAGRAFDEHDTAGAAPVVVINEVTARRYWPGENPIGKRVQGKIPMTVIGVVGSVRRGSMREAPKEEIYRPLPQFLFGLHGSTLVLRTTAGISPESLINTVQSTLTKQYPTFPVSEIRPMTSWIEESVATSRLYTVLLGGFSVQALLIASAGLFGLLSHIAAIRRREMGVRIAIGARPSQIALLLLRQGLAIVSIGAAAGAFGGVLLADLLRTQLYGIEPTDPTTLCAVAGAFAIIAVLAMLAPALRAGRTDPAHILRAD
ncbi:MAG TPA: FtsX-like permease family protein, partial [Bryobacteraceae bacterium]|nr:FtsX-like permease family protein [Bryobacteraceae bacterium]